MTRLWLCLCSCALGCHATAGANASLNSEGDSKLTAQAELSENAGAASAPSSASTGTEPLQAEAESATPALLGARAGLHLSESSTATCSCLAVVVGQPKDAAFRWDGEASTIDSASQLVVALGSDGVPCAAPPSHSLGASYYGHVTSGLDVIVQVEIGRQGRPIAQGAVIPKPGSGGRVLVRPVEPSSPYGRSADGKDPQCVVYTTP